MTKRTGEEIFTRIDRGEVRRTVVDKFNRTIDRSPGRLVWKNLTGLIERIKRTGEEMFNRNDRDELRRANVMK